MKRSSVGKSSTVQRAWMLAWMSISPQLRWNIRMENAPCMRVTWLCQSSMGLMRRLPYSSSWAYGPKTLHSSTLALPPSGCLG